MHSLEPDYLAAGAGEDRAALSGRPRKANAGQYETVMQQRAPVRNRDATTTPSPHAQRLNTDPVRNSGFDNLLHVRPIRLMECHFELPTPRQR